MIWRPVQTLFTIYHYTDELDHLFKIIQNGFYPTYCKEEIVIDLKMVKFAIPILSFCDLPLSQVKDHMKKYDEYAIGLSMEWAVRYGLNPVMYLEQKSILNRGIQEMLDFNFLDWHKMLSPVDYDKFYDKVYRGTLNTLQSIKNYKGILIRKVSHQWNTSSMMNGNGGIPRKLMKPITAHILTFFLKQITRI